VAFLHTPSSCLEGRQANKLWIRFLYDGTRINEDDTPGSLDMDDNGMVFFSYKILSCLIHFPDTIDVMVERTYRNAARMQLLIHRFLQRLEVQTCVSASGQPLDKLCLRRFATYLHYHCIIHRF
jgi:hypothetical protein